MYEKNRPALDKLDRIYQKSKKSYFRVTCDVTDKVKHNILNISMVDPLNAFFREMPRVNKRLKGASQLGRSCYIRPRRDCVPMNTFDAIDYESALRFFFNCLLLEKSIFEILNNY